MDVNFAEKGLTDDVAEFSSALTVVANHERMSKDKFLAVGPTAVSLFDEEFICSEDAEQLTSSKQTLQQPSAA